MSPPLRLSDDDFGSRIGAALRTQRPSPPRDLERTAVAALRPSVPSVARPSVMPLVLACAVAGAGLLVLNGRGPAEPSPPPPAAAQLAASPNLGDRGDLGDRETAAPSHTVGAAPGESPKTPRHATSKDDKRARGLTAKEARQLKSLEQEADRARGRSLKAKRDAARATEREQELARKIQALEAKQRKAMSPDAPRDRALPPDPIRRWVEGTTTEELRERVSCKEDPLCGIPDDPFEPPQLAAPSPEPDPKPIPPLTLKSASNPFGPSPADTADLRQQLAERALRLSRCGRYTATDGLVYLRIEAKEGTLRLQSSRAGQRRITGSTAFVSCINGVLSRIRVSPSAEAKFINYPVRLRRAP